MGDPFVPSEMFKQMLADVQGKDAGGQCPEGPGADPPAPAPDPSKPVPLSQNRMFLMFLLILFLFDFRR